ncbi:MAG TPA: ComEA family DNA-binding protein [Candidatus Omnitrophota bacterium]|nr:ComEA family DNA-binding protein [Candidatus Omnitrophota bacterium]HPB67609.1 ComEA family DNA-binding protein [Candidatus Omnitrophota bacterium]HQO57637.1 ComEA family DNA-binding protein [Candidatus Omnitrophota bacterium]HQP11361.1 ComEA family DNA-binding protein [Candidatus Omnitrophota bacterium]
MPVSLTKQERLVLCFFIGVLVAGTGIQGVIKRIPDTRPQPHVQPRRPPGGKLDINSASQEELLALPCVGPVTARRIMDYRQKYGPFRDLAQLKEIKGIGPAKYLKLRAHIAIQDPGP